MKRCLLCLLCLLYLTPPVSAQAVSTAKATWVQQNAVADAQAFKYTLKDGTGTPVPVTNTACVVAQGVVTCSGDVPLPAAGPHQFTLIAATADGSLSAASPVLVGVMPGAPQGFKVIVTVILTP